MVTTYGSFPGIQVDVAGGGITAITVGDEEKLVLIGEASYDTSDEVDGTATANEPRQINARREADDAFGEGSLLADAMREALANGAEIDFLYGVAPERVSVENETFDNTSSATGTLTDWPIIEDLDLIDLGVDATVEFRYDGAPATPTADDTVYINPLTGGFAVTSGSVTNINSEIDYKFLDWETTFNDGGVQGVIDENETGIFKPLSESDQVSQWLEPVVDDMRETYQMVNALSAAEPNDNEMRDGVAYANYDTGNYDTANQSIDADYYFKYAPARLRGERKTIGGGVAGVFAGNEITNAIYNDEVAGYGTLEQEFTRNDAENMRGEHVIPIRQNGSVRIKDNLSTSTSTDWERDFWRRRIADRVILIAKTIGDSILGRINDEEARNSAERMIRQEIRELVDDRLLRPNTEDETNWYVDVYPPSDPNADPNEVKIDIGFTPYGIIKRVDTSITIRT